MKSLKLFGSFFAGLIVLTSASVEAGSDTNDDFNDNNKSSAWDTDIAVEGSNVFLTETNMHLEFTGTTTGNSTVLRPWIAGFGTYTQNWEVAADINMGMVALPYAGIQMFVAVAKSGDSTFSNRLVAGLDLDNEEGDGTDCSYTMESAVNGIEITAAPNYGEVATASTNGRMRIAFDASTKILAASYNGNPLGFIDVDQAGTSWNMTSASTFTVALGGSMGTYSGTFTNNSHEVSADNFELRTGNMLPYLLTINNGTGSGNYTNNASVSITASNAQSGQVFDHWAGSTQYLANVTSTTTTVTMPAQAISLTPAYKLTGTSSGDDFNDNVLNTPKWGDACPLDGMSTDVFMTETNAHLEFTGSAEVVRPWIAGYGSYTQSWEVAVAVYLGNVALAEPDAYVNMNLRVFNLQDTNWLNSVIKGDLFNIALDLYRDGEGNLIRGYELTSYVNASELSGAPSYGYAVTADRQGRLKVAFDAATKILTASYNGNVLGWVDVDAPGSNWEMTNVGNFGFAIGGGAGTVNIASGEAYADNFMTVGAVTPPEKDFTYTTNSGSITITDYTGAGGDVTIPSIINGYPVTILGDWVFINNTNITSVIIPNSVVTIGEATFDECTSLTNITMGSGVTSYGSDALSGLSSLIAISVDVSNTVYSSVAGVMFDKNKTTLILYPNAKAGSFTIPDSLSSIELGVFYRCTNLTAIVANTANPYFSSTNGILFNKSWTEIVQFPGGKAGSYAVTGNVSRIGVAAFAGCPGLTNVTIGSGVTNIGNYAFVGCISLTGVTVNVANAFYSSSNGVLFNKSQTVLIQCPGGKVGSYTTPSSVTNIGEMAFTYCIGLTNITISSAVTSIEPSTFLGCTGLKSIVIGSGVTNIGEDAFWNCTSLSSVMIPNSVVNIDGWAFENCTSLTNVMIGNGVTSIGQGAFESCPSLISATIGSNVTSISDFAFAHCTNLIGVYFLGNAPNKDSHIFYDTSNTTVYRLSGATGWPTVSDVWAGRPTALWQPQASDADADGIPDFWEQQYFGGITNANPNAICSNGINTVIQAYVAGINPTDSAARFSITNYTRNVLQWNAVSGRVYNVYWTTNLMNSFQPLQINYTGGVITDSLHSAASKCFYKIEVRLAP